MKTLKTLKYALLALVGISAVACSEDNTYTPGAPEEKDCYGVYFVKEEANQTLELDPTESTAMVYTVIRQNATDAVTVPVKIDANTDNLFSISPIEFAEGEDETTFTVSLSSESELGVEYEFGLSVVDPKFVPQYISNTTKPTSIHLSITRIKWVDLGEVAYTEDVLLPWCEEDNATYNVMLQVRENSVKDIDALKAAIAGAGSDADLAGVYRLVDPYNCGPFAGEVTIGVGSTSGPYALTHNAGTHYVVIDATDPTHVFIELSDTGLVINGTGSTSYVYSYAAYYMDEGGYGKYEIPDEYYGTLSGGSITFPVDKILHMPSDGEPGSLYYGNRSGKFCLNIAPALAKYTLQMPKGTSDGDFTFEEVALGDAIFYSESQTASWYPILEKGEPSVTTDNVHRDFYMTYGTLYRLPECYAEGYHIYFAVKDGKVVVPANYTQQMTGLNQNGMDIYMKINAASSKFNAETNEVSLVAEFLGVSGTKAVSFGEYNEVVSLTAPEDFDVVAPADLRADFTYSTLFNDTFTSTFTKQSWKADFQKGACIDEQKGEAFEKNVGTAYRLPNLYAANYDLYFAADAEGNVVVPADYKVQPTGMTLYGTTIYAVINSGVVTAQGANLSITFTDIDGNVIQPIGANCKEQILTYVWSEVSTGTLSVNGFGAEMTERVLANAEGTNIYRIENCWGYDKHIVFTWDKQTNKCELDGLCATGMTYSGFEIYLCDHLGFFTWVEYDFDWAFLESKGYHQPSFDPATNTFTFELYYAAPDAGAGMTLGEFFTETFVLDSAPVTQDGEDYKVGTFTHTTDFFTLPSLPFAEEGVVLQRYGDTNKYRFAVGAGTFVLEFTYDEATGAVKVPANSTGLTATVPEGQAEIYYGDWWAMASAWGMTLQDGTPLTEEMVYGIYPNSYDAATQTFSFYLGYFDLEYGYVFTSVNEGDPTIHTFQITGDPEPSTGEEGTEEGGAEQASKSFSISNKATKNGKFTPRVVDGKLSIKDSNLTIKAGKVNPAAKRVDVSVSKGIADAQPKAYNRREASIFKTR